MWVSTVEIILTAETRFFFIGRDFLNWDFSFETLSCHDCQDKSRFSRFVETFPNLSRYLNIIETFWDTGTSGSKILTNWEILIEKIDKSTNLNLDWDFLIVKINFFKVSRFSQMSRLTTFCSCQDWDSWSRHNGDK